jgi:PAS domain S-box-containing protein
VTPRRAARDGTILLLYVALGYLGRALGLYDGLAVWFPPAGVALAAAALWGWSVLPVLMVADLVVSVGAFGFHLDANLLQVATSVVLKAGVWCSAGVLLRREGVDPLDVRVHQVVPAIVVALVLAPASAAVLGVAVRVWAGATAMGDVPRDLVVWAIGDAIGVATVAPAVLIVARAVLRPPVRMPEELLQRPPLVTALLLASPTIVAVALFRLAPGATSGLYLVFLPMVLVAMFAGTTGVAVSALALSPTMTVLVTEQTGQLVLERADVQVLLLGLLVTGYLVAIPLDASRLLTTRLRRRQADLAEAQHLARMGSFHWDVLHDRIRWSDGLQELFGRDVREAPTTIRDYLDGVHPEDRATVRRAIGDVLAGNGPLGGEYRIVRRDGEQRWVTSRVEAVEDATGQVAALAGYCQDITEQHDARAAQAQATAREQAAAEELRRTEQVKDELLVAISHEVRTPLTVLSGLATTLGRPEVADQPDLVQPLADRIQLQADRLGRLLGDLLDTDRLHRGTLVPRLRPTALRPLVDGVVAGHDVGDHPVDVQVGVERAVVDPAMLTRMLESMLVNALRYTPPRTPIWVRVTEAGGTLAITVEDAGPGVPPDQRDAVFRPFHQDRRIEHSPGTGLGLYLVAEFAALHGGRAWVEEGRRGGARFRVDLPEALAGGPLPESQRIPPGV